MMSWTAYLATVRYRHGPGSEPELRDRCEHHMEASCFSYVKVGMIDLLEQSKICVLTVTSLVVVIIPHNMTWRLACVSCKIPGMPWANHHQTSIPSKNVLSISVNQVISAVVHINICLYTIKPHPTDILQIAGLVESDAACNSML